MRGLLSLGFEQLLLVRGDAVRGAWILRLSMLGALVFACFFENLWNDRAYGQGVSNRTSSAEKNRRGAYTGAIRIFLVPCAYRNSLAGFPLLVLSLSGVLPDWAFPPVL